MRASLRDPRSQLLVSVVALILGVLIVVQIRSQAGDSGLAERSAQDLTLLVANLNTRNDQLRTEVSSLDRQLQALEVGGRNGTSSLNQIRDDLARIRAWAGLDPVAGRGVEITISGAIDGFTWSPDGRYVLALRQDLRDKSEPLPAELIYPWPAPETIGLTLAPDQIAKIETVTAGSAAAKAGLKSGDELLSLAGQPLVAPADARDPALLGLQAPRTPDRDLRRGRGKRIRGGFQRLLRRAARTEHRASEHPGLPDPGTGRRASRRRDGLTLH